MERLPDELLVARAAVEDVLSGSTDEDVVAVAAVGVELDCVGGESGAVDHVVTRESFDRELVLSRVGMGATWLASVRAASHQPR